MLLYVLRVPPLRISSSYRSIKVPISAMYFENFVKVCSYDSTLIALKFRAKTVGIGPWRATPCTKHFSLYASICLHNGAGWSENFRPRAGNTMFCQLSFVSCPWAEENGKQQGVVITKILMCRCLDSLTSACDVIKGECTDGQSPFP